MYVVAMDWPGHGLSTKRPHLYHSIDYISDIRYVMDGMHLCNYVVDILVVLCSMKR